MKKGIIVSLLLSLIFVQSAYCYKFTVINDIKKDKYIRVRVPAGKGSSKYTYRNRTVKKGKKLTFSGPGCVLGLTGYDYLRGDQTVTHIGGTPFEDLKKHLCGDFTTKLSTWGY